MGVLQKNNALAALIARKGEASPAAKISGRSSWFSEIENQTAPNASKPSPLADQDVLPTDLVKLITPKMVEAKSLPVKDVSEIFRPSPIPNHSAVNSIKGAPRGVAMFRSAQELSGSKQSVRRKMTLRLPMEKFWQLHQLAEGENKSYQALLQSAVLDYLTKRGC